MINAVNTMPVYIWKNRCTRKPIKKEARQSFTSRMVYISPRYCFSVITVRNASDGPRIADDHNTGLTIINVRKQAASLSAVALPYASIHGCTYTEAMTMMDTIMMESRTMLMMVDRRKLRHSLVWETFLSS